MQRKPGHIITLTIGIQIAICLFSIRGVTSARTPFIKQFEVDEYNNVIRPYKGPDPGKPSQIIAEKVKNLRLECHADYPVQWIYTGNGIPLINTDISLATTLLPAAERKNDENYVASIFLGSLKEQHTGKYQCSRTDYVTVVPNLYVFVPGQDLFTSTEGKTIQINSKVSSILIPCSVSDPRIKVSLFKLSGDVLKRIVTKSDDAIAYDPQKGFRVKLTQIEDPEGKYICTANSKDDVRDVEYTITSTDYSDDFQSDAPQADEPQSDAPANYEEPKKEVKCEDKPGRQCATHTDCPTNMHCYTDCQCRDPCTYSIECGKAAVCRLVDHRPKCYCPPGFVGDPTKECLNIKRERYQQS